MGLGSAIIAVRVATPQNMPTISGVGQSDNEYANSVAEELVVVDVVDQHYLVLARGVVEDGRPTLADGRTAHSLNELCRESRANRLDSVFSISAEEIENEARVMAEEGAVSPDRVDAFLKALDDGSTEDLEDGEVLRIIVRTALGRDGGAFWEMESPDRVGAVRGPDDWDW